MKSIRIYLGIAIAMGCLLFSCGSNGNDKKIRETVTQRIEGANKGHGRFVEEVAFESGDNKADTEPNALRTYQSPFGLLSLLSGG